MFIKARALIQPPIAYNQSVYAERTNYPALSRPTTIISQGKQGVTPNVKR